MRFSSLLCWVRRVVVEWAGVEQDVYWLLEKDPILEPLSYNGRDEVNASFSYYEAFFRTVTRMEQADKIRSVASSIASIPSSCSIPQSFSFRKLVKSQDQQHNYKNSEVHVR